jgi:hypothetical protein
MAEVLQLTEQARPQPRGMDCREWKQQRNQYCGANEKGGAERRLLITSESAGAQLCSFLRRMANAMPTNPAPNSPSVPGSGTEVDLEGPRDRRPA